jgi:hypothetical protein
MALPLYHKKQEKSVSMTPASIRSTLFFFLKTLPVTGTNDADFFERHCEMYIEIEKEVEAKKVTKFFLLLIQERKARKVKKRLPPFIPRAGFELLSERLEG